MRIAHLTDTPRMGGAERVLEDVVGACAQAGHEVTVMAPQEWLLDRVAAGVSEVATMAIGSDDYAHTPGRFGRGRALAALFLPLVRALRSVSPQVVHVHNGGYPGSDLCRLGMIAARVAGVPRRLLTVHATPRRRDESSVWLQTAVDRAVWWSTHTVIGATEAVGMGLRDLRGMPDDERWRRIPYGVPAPSGAREAGGLRASLGVGPDEFLAGMISATDDEQKGHRVLVEALALNPRAHAVVAGAPLPAAAASRASELGLGDRLIVTGRLPAIGPLFHAIDALVVPSVSDESLPLVVLEAMAAAKPVIASRLAGIPEAVFDGVTGRLFEPGDVRALATGLEELADDPARSRAYGQEARRRWSAQFSVGAMTAAILALYGRR